jgi:hypothetical protein
MNTETEIVWRNSKANLRLSQAYALVGLIIDRLEIRFLKPHYVKIDSLSPGTSQWYVSVKINGNDPELVKEIEELCLRYNG